MSLPRPRFLPTLRLGGLPVRSFLRSPLPVAALVALAVIPLLYAGLYLWAFWDPFGRTGQVPVALVNEDRPTTVEGERVHAGDDLADELVRRGDLDWHRVDAAKAADGLEHGRYYVVLTIPRDFSARLAAPADTDRDPVPTLLRAHYNDANNYIARELLTMGFKDIRDAVSRTATSRYLDRMFLGFNEIHGRTEEAADGADQLADGTDDAKDGADQLLDGLGDAEDGATELHDGLDDARDGSADLRDGLGELYDGSETLADGSTTASDQLDAKVDRLDTLADEWVPKMRDRAPEIESGANAISDAAGKLSDALDRLPEASSEESKRLRRVHARLQDHREDLEAECRTECELYTLLTDAQAAVGRAVEFNDFVVAHQGRIEEIEDDADEVSRLAADVAEEAPDLADDAEAARDQVDELNDALAEIARGNRDLRDGLADAYDGSAELDQGIGDLDKGAGDLEDGITDLHDGAGDLDDGIGDLRDGAHDLSDGLSDGLRRIPTFDRQSRDARDDMMSQPVRLSSSVDNKAPTYGTGFAPFFVALSLWVGALLVFLVLPAVSERGLASAAPSWRLALAGWLPPMAIGAVQVAVMMLALHLLLGLNAERWAGVLGLLLLAAAAYTATVQWLNAGFGAPGKVAGLVLLMLQITSAGGTYPLETSPGFFQAVAPYLPMYWVVSALRHLISGGDLTLVWQACAVLTGYLVIPLVLTWLTVVRKRVWTMNALHPALEL